MKVGSGGNLGLSREYSRNYLGLYFIHGVIVLKVLLSLNNTNHYKVIIYYGLSRILNFTKELIG